MLMQPITIQNLADSGQRDIYALRRCIEKMAPFYNALAPRIPKLGNLPTGRSLHAYLERDLPS